MKLISLHRAILLLFMYNLLGSAMAQTEWKKVKEDGNIEVFTRKLERNGFKEIKIEATVKSSLNAIMAAFNDVEAHKEWVYKTPESTLVSLQSNGSINYYVRLDLPFPVQDRDLVINYAWEQDRNTKVVTTSSYAIENIIPAKEDLVRVKAFYSNYVLTPYPNGKVHISYIAKMDPGGKIPNWLVNMGVTIGPTKSMKSLFELLASGRYERVKVEGVEELTKT